MHAKVPTVGKARRKSSNPWNILAGLLGLLLVPARGEEWPDLRSVPADLVVPPLSEAAPAAGLRVKQRLPAYEGTQIHHVLYLPTDWAPEKKFPVLVEYAGNGGFSNRLGDVSTGVPERSNLGYGISGGRGFIWLCVPYVQTGRTEICRRWWGDVPATLDYCREAVQLVCERYGGDPAAVILTGFSRGAIGCGYLGLHNDEIAKLWRAFIPFSHYDGVDRFPYAGSDAASALRRMQRLNGRPSFICHEASVERTKAFIAQSGVDAPFTFEVVPFRNHNDEWALRPSPARDALRAWLDGVLRAPVGRRGGTPAAPR